MLRDRAVVPIGTDLVAAVARTVAAAPPFNEGQRDRIAAVFGSATPVDDHHSTETHSIAA